MPNLWILNIEDSFSDGVEPDIIPIYMGKYLWCLNHKDIAIVPNFMEIDFAQYLSRVKNLPQGTNIIPIAVKTPYSLIESVMENHELLQRIKQWIEHEKYTLQFYTHSPRAASLISALGLTRETTLSDAHISLLTQANNKQYFKQLAKEANILVPQWLCSNDINELGNQIATLCPRASDLGILKKVQSCGGAGNYIGTRETLLNKVHSDWLKPDEPVIIEQYIPFDTIYGTLIEISKGKIQYIGADQQIVDNGKWNGLTYPVLKKSISQQLKKASQRLGRVCLEKGICGSINIDWGGLIHQGQLHLYGLEINARYNALEHFIRCFGRSKRKLHYYTGYHLQNENTTKLGETPYFYTVLHQLESSYHDGKNILADHVDAPEGVILTDVNHFSQTFGCLIFSNSINYIQQMQQYLGERFR